jgi:hypothetical protein
MTINFTVSKADLNDVAWIAKSEREYYMGLDVIPEKTLRSWYGVNNKIFSVLKRDGINVGCLDVLPLRDNPLQELIDGDLCEAQVTSACIYEPEEKNKVKFLWVENFMVLLETEPIQIKAKAIKAILTALEGVVEELCCSANLENIFCIVATERGERLVRMLGFELAGTGLARGGDGHDLYKVEWPVLQQRIDRILDRQ